MGHNYTKRIARLEELTAPILPDDTMAESGRKVLRLDFIGMLQHEAGSRSGEDIEEVHDMRVATRRLRSTFRLLGDYYKPKVVDGYMRRLRRTAHALGAVRDLDVMLADMARFQATLDEAEQAAFQSVCDHWIAKRDAARKSLLRALDKDDYRRFVKEFSGFVTKSGAGASAAGKASEDEVSPFQLRHVLPGMLYECLATVRAYDTVLVDDVPVERLHALRIEFKRLRYAVTLFQEVLGPEI
ncbi:MAG: CHAD domain-containing protein, partial [Burkholderiales bacterium]|nr:CHAD domain-containing protein [Anaerolineae bacterium]